MIRLDDREEGIDVEGGFGIRRKLFDLDGDSVVAMKLTGVFGGRQGSRTTLKLRELVKSVLKSYGERIVFFLELVQLLGLFFGNLGEGIALLLNNFELLLLDLAGLLSGSTITENTLNTALFLLFGSLCALTEDEVSI